MPPTLPPARCALTAPFHPYPGGPRRSRRGGLLSVALSLGSPPPDVIRRRVRMEPGLSSAFDGGGRPADWLTRGIGAARAGGQAEKEKGAADRRGSMTSGLFNARPGGDSPGDTFDRRDGALAPGGDPPSERRGIGLAGVLRGEYRLAAVAQTGIRVTGGRVKRLTPDEGIDGDRAQTVSLKSRAWIRRLRALLNPPGNADRRSGRASFIAALSGLWDCAAPGGRLARTSGFPPRPRGNPLQP